MNLFAVWLILRTSSFRQYYSSPKQHDIPTSQYKAVLVFILCESVITSPSPIRFALPFPLRRNAPLVIFSTMSSKNLQFEGFKQHLGSGILKSYFLHFEKINIKLPALLNFSPIRCLITNHQINFTFSKIKKIYV